MKNADYEKLFLELLGPLPVSEDLHRKQIEEMTRADLDRLVPLIDDMTKQAENRGRFAALLEMTAERLENGKRRTETISTGNTAGYGPNSVAETEMPELRSGSALDPGAHVQRRAL